MTPLLRAWRHLDGLAGPDALRAWLYRIPTKRWLTTRAASARRRVELPLDALIASMGASAASAAMPFEPFPEANLGGIG